MLKQSHCDGPMLSTILRAQAAGGVALSPGRLAFLAAVMDLAGPITFRKLMRRLGYRSPNAVSSHVVALAAQGLVRYEPGKISTLRPACVFIPADQLGA